MSVITCRSQVMRGVRELSERRPMEALFNYVGGTGGAWRVTEMATRSGQPLKPATHVEVTNGPLQRSPAGAAWMLRGVVSNTRYVTCEERHQLESRQPVLNRSEATCATLIPLQKSAAWWSLAQDERRDILETRSRHIATGLRFLPAIARRLLHGRDLGEPFDFVTWFEYAPCDTAVFDELVAALRASDEWKYVEREIDIRLVRASDGVAS
jgi:hypothetical protein